MSRENTQFQRKQVVSAWKEIIIANQTLKDIGLTFLIPMDTSSSNFIMVESETGNTTSGFQEISNPALRLTDTQLQFLVKHLTVRFPGLPGFTTGINCLKKYPEESDVAFAKRQFFSFLSLQPYNELKQEITLLQEVHEADRANPEKHKNQFSEAANYINYDHEALAETAYYFDQINKRLIIRHAPIEAITHADQEIASNTLHSVTQHILEHLVQQHDIKNRTTINVEHIVPCIKPGRCYIEKPTAITDDKFPAFKQMMAGAMKLAGIDPEKSKHIVCDQFNESYVTNTQYQPYPPIAPHKDDEITTLRKRFHAYRSFDPRHSIMPNFLRDLMAHVSNDAMQTNHIDVQQVFNDQDCGLHVTVMATVAAQLLASNPQKNAGNMQKEDFTQYPEVTEASHYKNPETLRALLSKIDRTHNAKKKDESFLTQCYSNATCLLFSALSNIPNIPSSPNEKTESGYSSGADSRENRSNRGQSMG